MKLILITNPEIDPEEPALVSSLFEHGLETLHLRKPSMSTAEMYAYIKAIPAHFHPQIVIHSHHKLALQFQLGGIHLTRIHRRRKLSNWIRLRWIKTRRPKLSVSASYHKLGHLYDDKGKYSYLLLGPVYSKPGGAFGTGFNAISIKIALAKIKTPVIARGGVTAANAATLQQLGFAGIAIQTTFWNTADPLQEFLNIAAQLNAADQHS